MLSVPYSRYALPTLVFGIFFLTTTHAHALTLLTNNAPSLDAPAFPETALRVSDSPLSGSTYAMLNVGLQITWDTPGGDWRDKNGTLQGNVPWAVGSVPRSTAEDVISFNVTDLVKKQVPGAVDRIPNRGWLLKYVSGSTGSYYTREDTGGRQPMLEVATATKLYKIPASADTALNNSTVYPTTGSANNITISNLSTGAMWFDLSKVVGPVTSATLKITKQSKQFGAGVGQIAVYPVDLTKVLAIGGVQYGTANNYINDVGLEKDPNTILLEKFPDLTMYNRGWLTPLAQNQALIGDTDPADPKYKPLATGIKAWKITIPQGQNGVTFAQWPLWSNLGYEPDELYIRTYARLGNNFDSGAGKFPFGFDGRYDPVTFQPLPNGKQLSTNPVTGRAWKRPNTPTPGGWGGRTSNGTNGWSARGGYIADVCGSNAADDCTKPRDPNPLTLSGFRSLHTYAYSADQVSTFGDLLEWHNGLAGIIPKNQWFLIDQYIKLNTVNADGSGNKDGILRIWVNGRLAYEKTNMRMRNWPGNPAGANNIKMNDVWIDFYHGGTGVARSPMDVYFSNMVISKAYVGPTKFVGLSVPGPGLTPLLSADVEVTDLTTGTTTATSTPVVSAPAPVVSVGPVLPSRISEDVTTGSTWKRISQSPAYAWANDGGDWVDREIQPQGTAPFAQSSLPRAAVEQKIAFNVTELVARQAGASPQPASAGWLLKYESGLTTSFYSKDAVDATKRPVLTVVTSTGTSTLNATSDIELNSSTVYSKAGNAPQITVQTNARGALYFDLTQVSGTVQSATLTLTSDAKQYGSGASGVFSIYAIDASRISVPSTIALAPIQAPLEKGSIGTEVKKLQSFLITKGLLAEESITGFFGKLTESALGTYQCKNGITCAASALSGWGRVGPKTQAVINEEIGK